MGGLVEFRKWQAQSKYSITARIELPISVMFSDERKGVMELFHQVVAVVKQKAIEFGFSESKAFAGGSCKELFCGDQKSCCVLSENKTCRHNFLPGQTQNTSGELIHINHWIAPSVLNYILSGKGLALNETGFRFGNLKHPGIGPGFLNINTLSFLKGSRLKSVFIRRYH